MYPHSKMDQATPAHSRDKQSLDLAIAIIIDAKCTSTLRARWISRKVRERCLIVDHQIPDNLEVRRAETSAGIPSGGGREGAGAPRSGFQRTTANSIRQPVKISLKAYGFVTATRYKKRSNKSHQRLAIQANVIPQGHYRREDRSGSRCATLSCDPSIEVHEVITTVCRKIRIASSIGVEVSQWRTQIVVHTVTPLSCYPNDC